MFGRRVPKSDQRVAAYGAVDELNAALGPRCAWPRIARRHWSPRRLVPAIQKDLVVLMGELATDPDDLERYLEAGFEQVSARMVDRISATRSRGIERDFEIKFKGWAMPGDAGHGGAPPISIWRAQSAAALSARW